MEDKWCFLCFKLEMEAGVAIWLGKGVRVDVVDRDLLTGAQVSCMSICLPAEGAR